MPNERIDPNADTDTVTKIKEPSMYNVVMLNDDFTPMEFVVHVLKVFFRKSQADSTAIMLEIHTKGSSIVGVYTREVAETKTKNVNDYSKEHEFPLLTRMDRN